MLRVADVLELRRPDGPSVLVDVDQMVVDVSSPQDHDAVLLKPAVFTVPMNWAEFVQVAAILVPGMTEAQLRTLIREQMATIAERVCR